MRGKAFAGNSHRCCDACLTIKVSEEVLTGCTLCGAMHATKAPLRYSACPDAPLAAMRQSLRTGLAPTVHRPSASSSILPCSAADSQDVHLAYSSAELHGAAPVRMI